MAEFFSQLIPGFFTSFFILTLAALAGMYCEKVGIVNIGINGQIIIGALGYSFFANEFQVETMWFQLILFPLAILITVAFSLLHGLACIKLKANQTISGVAINFLAYGIAAILLNFSGSGGRFESATNRLSWSQYDDSFKNLLSLETILFLLVVITTFIILNKTSWGLRFKAVGENPQAADVAGVNVNKAKWQGVIISGILSGIAGILFVEKIGVDSFDGTANGVGFLALSVMIMGRWKVIPILLAGFFFSLIQQLAAQIMFTNVAELQKFRSQFGNYLEFIPFFVTLVSLTIFSKKNQGPKALGVVYNKSQK